MAESSKPEKKSKFSRLLGSLTRCHGRRRSSERKGDSHILPELAPANVPNVSPSIADQGVNATARTPATQTPTELTEPVATGRGAESAAFLNTDVDLEKLPKNVAIAHDRLNKAGEKLKKTLPADLLAIGDFEIKMSADVNSVADNIGSTLDTFMEQRHVEESEQSHARELITEWAKKTIPFIETGVSIAKVWCPTPLMNKETESWQPFIPPPYNLIALGVVHVLKVCASSC